MRCAAHPEVETNLRCGKCEKPICPQCMVQTPVGARCPDCAQLYKLPTYRVSTQHYLKAIGAGLGIAIACGIVWGVVMGLAPFRFIFLNFIVAAGVGYAIGEVIGLSVNRKRGKGLAVVGGMAVVVGYLVSIFFPWGRSFPLFNMLYLILDLLALALGVFVAVTRLR